MGTYTTIYSRGYDNVPCDKIISGREFNELTNGQTQLKVMSDKMIHKDYKYVIGENLLNGKFSDTLCNHGLHFSNPDDIHNWINYGSKLHKVRIPNDAHVLCDYGKCKTDKLIIEEEITTREEMKKIGIIHPEIIFKFDNDVLYTPNELVDLLKKGLCFDSIPKNLKTKDFYIVCLQNHIINLYGIDYTLLLDEDICNAALKAGYLKNDILNNTPYEFRTIKFRLMLYKLNFINLVKKIEE
jgi:hypothetical protein